MEKKKKKIKEAKAETWVFPEAIQMKTPSNFKVSL